jgi:two-component system, NtrC family, response regulator GlrR
MCRPRIDCRSERWFAENSTDEVRFACLGGPNANLLSTAAQSDRSRAAFALEVLQAELQPLSRCSIPASFLVAGSRMMSTVRDPSRSRSCDIDEPQAQSVMTGVTERLQWSGIVGDSEAFNTMLRQIARIAPTDAVILLEGETGVGKELAARAIHYSSARQGKPFIAVNCGAIPETLAESELFGHARGAFTDAKTAHPGVIRQAHGGTLFLDEIDSLPAKAQVAMLRFLQDHSYRAVGEAAERMSDARIIAASNRSLELLVDRGVFRSDLMYRLNIIRIRVPPLRERRGDLPLLAGHFIELYRERYGFAPKTLDPECWDWMMRYDWPGNIRELESAIHRGMLLSEGDTIVLEPTEHGAEHEHASAQASLPAEPCTQRNDVPRQAPAMVFPDFKTAKASAIAEFEREYLSNLLEQTKGNVSAAARIAHKERRSLGKLIKKLGIDRAER